VLAIRYSPAPECRPIVTQLCMALAALAAKMEGWSCETIVRDIQGALGSGAPLALAETLRVLPEEIESKALSIHPDRRAQVRHALQASTRLALDLLDELWMQATEGRHAVAVLQATTSWIDFAPRELQPVTSRVALEAVMFFSPPSAPLSSGARVVTQHPDGITTLVSVVCATATSHAQAGVAGAQPLLDLLQPIVADLASSPSAALGHESTKTEAQLNIVSHAAVALLEASVAATAAQGLISVLLHRLAAGSESSWNVEDAEDDDQHAMASLPALQPFVSARELWDTALVEAEGWGRSRSKKW